MSINKRYEKLINLLKEWLNEESDQDLKCWGDMRDRRKKTRCAIAPRMNITKNPEIDRILEEAEAHMPISLDSREGHKDSDFMSFVNKEAVVSFLWRAIQSNIDALKILIGEDSFLKIASQRIEFCIEDWKDKNEMD